MHQTTKYHIKILRSLTNLRSFNHASYGKLNGTTPTKNALRIRGDIQEAMDFLLYPYAVVIWKLQYNGFLKFGIFEDALTCKLFA